MATIVQTPIDPVAVCAAVASPDAGALVTFAGTVRNEHLGRTVTGIEYHAYTGMAEKEMTRIEADIEARWPGTRAAIVHRTGALEVGETSVFIAVSGAHRKETFDAARYAIDTLKELAPIWKKEIYSDGYAWLEGS